MKAFGRLLLATALIVPAGYVTAESAGATPKPTATCTGNTGTLRLSPGVRLSKPVGQTIRNFTTGSVVNPTSPGELTGCTGVGIAEETSATFAFQISRSAVTCQSIRQKEFVGTGRLVWDEGGSNSGIVTTVKLRLKFNSYKAITFQGVVTDSRDADTGVKNGYLQGEPFSATASIPDKMKPVGVGGGECQNKKRVKTLEYEQTSDTKV
jgi:hypothetical protein